MKSITDVFPGSWDQLSASVSKLRDGLFGEMPAIDPVDISSLAVPGDLLQEIREKNLRRVRDEVSYDELTAEDSPYRTDAYFDDQLLEVMASIAHRYHPIDFVGQMVRFIESFVNESAAFKAGLVASRIKDEDADRVAGLVRHAADNAGDDDTRRTLKLLLVDLADGGEAPWAKALSDGERAYLDKAMADVG